MDEVDMTNDTMYAIGKATRCEAGDVVRKPPWDREIPRDVYDVLRSAIYTSEVYAEKACEICTQSNPVGFVVLVIGEPDEGQHLKEREAYLFEYGLIDRPDARMAYQKAVWGAPMRWLRRRLGR